MRRQHAAPGEAELEAGMVRLVCWLAVIAAGLVFWLVRTDADAPAWLALPSPSWSYGAWVAGLVMGLALAWFTRIDWSSLPERLIVWMRQQRRRVAWAVLGSVCLAILLYF
jgi:hypothetical protein